MSRETERSSMSTILIVDDDPHLRELSGIFLQREGFDVSEAANGIEALSFLENRKVDLVILDIMMPQMDGWEMCRRLRAWHDLPVLMLTAKGETSQKLKGFQVGADDTWSSPLSRLNWLPG